MSMYRGAGAAMTAEVESLGESPWAGQALFDLDGRGLSSSQALGGA
ncbi:hypothetical protein L0U85_10595 [Glycomyces sp. L485]|nr:hypothetical protein [Glycomyces sp. L485]MCH7231295.1 hypothetical protein [Glycomyces sp. L485]